MLASGCVWLWMLAVAHRERGSGLGREGEMQVVPVALHVIQKLSLVRIKLPKDLRPLDQRQSVHSLIKEVQRRFPDGEGSCPSGQCAAAGRGGLTVACLARG